MLFGALCVACFLTFFSFWSAKTSQACLNFQTREGPGTQTLVCPPPYDVPIYPFELTIRVTSNGGRIYPAAEPLVTNHLGQITGNDPRTGRTYELILGSSYWHWTGDRSENGISYPTEGVSVLIKTPARGRRARRGEYTLQIIGSRDGTYDLEISHADIEGCGTTLPIEFSSIPIRALDVHTYVVQYSVTDKVNVIVKHGRLDHRPRKAQA